MVYADDFVVCLVYDIEVQRASAGADVHRARFHSSMIDTKILKARQEFKEIHDSYVIFIAASDVLGAGCPLYHIKRMIEETGTYFGDGSCIIYVNASYKDDSDPVGKLMHDFRCSSSADMFYPVLAKQVKYFKIAISIEMVLQGKLYFASWQSNHKEKRYLICYIGVLLGIPARPF